MKITSRYVKKTPIWMRIFGVPRWKHITVTCYGGIAGIFEDTEVVYSDLPTRSDDEERLEAKDAEGQIVFKPARSTRSLDEWLVLEFDKAAV